MASVRLDAVAKETIGSQSQKSACQALVAMVSPLLVALWPVKYERRCFCPRITDARILNVDYTLRMNQWRTLRTKIRRDAQPLLWKETTHLIVRSV